MTTAATWLLSLAFSSLYQPAASREPTLSEMLWDVGTCVVDRQYGRAKEFVLAYPVDPSVSDRGLPSVGKCNAIFLKENIEVTFRTNEYRYALANALVRRDFSAHGPADFSSAATLRQPQPLLSPVTRRQKRSAKVFKAAQLYARVEAEEAAMGECITRAAPESARIWLITEPSSIEDVKIAKGLTPIFEKCARQVSGTKYFNPERVRGPVALIYVRLAYSQSRRAGGGTADA